MKKNIIFILLLSFILMIFFSTAAVCNRCTITDIEEPSEEEQDIGQQEQGSSSTDVADEDLLVDAGEEGDEAESQQEGNNPPSIEEIELWGTDIRVLASEGTFDGVPSEVRDLPFVISAEDQDGDEIEYYLEDDQGNSFEVNKIENDIAEAFWTPPIIGPYKLTFLVRDSKGGQDSYSVDMVIVEGEILEDEPVEPAEEDIDSPFGSILITADTGSGGYIIKDDAAYQGGNISIGDDDLNKQYKGYITFYLDGLEGVTVRYIEINVDGINKTGLPSNISNRLDIKSFDYGESLDYGDFSVGGTVLVNLAVDAIESSGSFSFNSETAAQLIPTLQSAIESGSGRYQLKLGLASGTNNNGDWDMLSFHSPNVSMEVNFER